MFWLFLTTKVHLLPKLALLLLWYTCWEILFELMEKHAYALIHFNFVFEFIHKSVKKFWCYFCGSHAEKCSLSSWLTMHMFSFISVMFGVIHKSLKELYAIVYCHVRMRLDAPYIFSANLLFISVFHYCHVRMRLDELVSSNVYLVFDFIRSFKKPFSSFYYSTCKNASNHFQTLSELCNFEGNLYASWFERGRFMLLLVAFLTPFHVKILINF